MAVRRCMSVACASSLPVYFIGFGVFLVSFTCANWVQCNDDEDGSRYAYGLWWNCSTVLWPNSNDTVVAKHECVFYDIDALEDSWMASQGFYLIALVLTFLAGTMYPIVPVNAILQTISGASILISSIIFAAAVNLQDGEKYDYAFYLGPLSGVLLTGNGILLGACVRKEHCTFEDIPLPSKAASKGV